MRFVLILQLKVALHPHETPLVTYCMTKLLSAVAICVLLLALPLNHHPWNLRTGVAPVTAVYIRIAVGRSEFDSRSKGLLYWLSIFVAFRDCWDVMGPWVHYKYGYSCCMSHPKQSFATEQKTKIRFTRKLVPSVFQWTLYDIRFHQYCFIEKKCDAWIYVARRADQNITHYI